jgi:alkaline phosphatase
VKGFAMRDDERNRMTRRRALGVLGLGGLGGVSLLSGCDRSSGAEGRAGERAAVGGAGRAGDGPRPRNIIFMVSDGMSQGTLSLADPFSRIVRGPDRATAWLSLMQRPEAIHGLQETHSLDSLVTDSAAAASAWGCGSRVANRVLNMLPDGTKLTSIAELAQSAGRRVGLVTTTMMAHATPAGFAVQHPNRGDYEAIAAQYLDRVDVLMGGGIEHFDPLRRADGVDLFGRYSAAGYTFWDTRSRVLSPDRPDRVLGLFHTEHLPYTLDHRRSRQLIERVPTLAEMTRAALGVLSASSRGFVLQVEGGRVDHAAHANDAAAMMWDQLAFDDAIAEALQFADGRGDTLVVITTDHGNANPGLNGMGPGYRSSGAAFELLAKITASFDIMRAEMVAAERTPQTVSDVIKAHTGIEVDAREAQAIHTTLTSLHADELNAQHRGFVGVMGQVLGNHTGIQFTGISHTADYAHLTAIGPGSHRFHGLHRNTDTFHHFCSLMGVRHENPSLDPAEPWRVGVGVG